jgi:hypothetical protein
VNGCWHKYGKWQDGTAESALPFLGKQTYQVQARRCVKCNKLQVRSVRADR